MKTKISFKDAFNRKFSREKYILDHIKKFNNNKHAEWCDFTRVFLIELVEYFKETLSPNSARTYCANLKSLLNKYSEEIEIPCKDYAPLLSLKKTGVINTYLTPEEIQQIIDYLPESEMEHAIRNQFLLSCLTGMRFSDVINLDATNLNNSEIVYVAIKTKTAVTTISSPVTEFLIAEQENTYYPAWKFNEQIKIICKKAGINSKVKVVRGGETETGEKWEFVSSHTARRSFATNIYLKTLDLFLVSTLMGHSDVKITQGYLCCAFRKNNLAMDYVNQFQIAI
ncbi:site-specific integrase [Dysgonomonas sp. 25]|uniref:site-specific integrase n=1 Tax=Dysgonomonas sp. 25 TaxID=2302933 RepID=UPI0013D7F80C|nr:site-specific integrase [Dysgonomonas sp. 25]NDV68639.1 recombinase [Dysgonomonas sp. 25]